MTNILPQAIEDQLRSSQDRSPDLLEIMRNARKASDFLKALSHESRLLVLCLLAERERSVREIEEILSLCQPTVSQQLARLRYDNLVATRREGKNIYYSLANNDVREVISVVYDIFCKRTRGNRAN
jgi:DNA-binding transcriptional ArsR family regulator